MIAPILLPLFAVFTSLLASPAPVLEWHVTHRDDHSCSLSLTLVTSGEADISKLSLVPGCESVKIDLTSPGLPGDEHWERDNMLHWMWHKDPKQLSLVAQLSWDPSQDIESTALAEVHWEQVQQGQRDRWMLGKVEHADGAANQATPFPSKIQALRMATKKDDNTAEVSISVQHTPPGSFVKITEYIPSACTCEVLDPAGASLRKEDNAQVFLWFQTPSSSSLTPRYNLRCATGVQNLAFDGQLEVALGTQTDLLHIAGVEWRLESPSPTESLELFMSPDSTSVASPYAATTHLIPEATATPGLDFAVQLLANHRDIEGDEMMATVGYRGAFQTTRHEGWHKHLTLPVRTYREAHSLRSDIWSETNAGDAFVTASLEGERITVQEALLLSNQTWIP